MRLNKKVISIIVVALVLVVAVGVLFAFNSSRILNTIGVTKPAPVFTFDQSKAPEWWAADNYNSKASTKPENYEGSEPIDKLPVASMNVFIGKKGEYKTACFVLFSYYDYKADTEQLKKNKENEVLASSSMKKVGEGASTITILGETKPVAMVNYELVGPDAENSMKGMGYGWVGLDDGYVSVNSVCPTAGELGDTQAAMNAISLVRQ